MKPTSAAIKAINEVESAFHLATLISETAQGYLLEDDGIQLNAMLAFSCLVKPQAGDQVLYARSGNGQSIIVSIVSRQGDQSMQLEFPQNASLASKTGNLNLNAAQSISLSATRMNTLSQTSVQTSQQAYLRVQQLHADGDKLQVNYKSVLLVSQFINTLAKQVVSKFKRYMRHSEDIDQVKAANMTRSAEGLLNMNAGHTVMVSKNDTKIDAARIHIG